MASHFYHPDTLELIPGGMREARKLNGLPSPTTVLSMLSNPGLIHYFKKQMWEATVTTPRLPGWSDDDHFKACQRWADEHGQAARDKGGDIHDLLQAFHCARMRGYSDPVAPANWSEQYDEYRRWADHNIDTIIAVEQRVAGDGYAGRMDVLLKLRDMRIAVTDTKSQDIRKRNKFLYYTNWALQLGAYAGALPSPADCLISVCITSHAPVALHAHEWPKPVSYYHGLFLGLLAIWREENQFF